jgi:hypothetical protein
MYARDADLLVSNLENLKNLWVDLINTTVTHFHDAECLSKDQNLLDKARAQVLLRLQLIKAAIAHGALVAEALDNAAKALREGPVGRLPKRQQPSTQWPNVRERYRDMDAALDTNLSMIRFANEMEEPRVEEAWLLALDAKEREEATKVPASDEPDPSTLVKLLGAALMSAASRAGPDDSESSH